MLVLFSLCNWRVLSASFFEGVLHCVDGKSVHFLQILAIF